MTTAPKSIEIGEMPELPESWAWARFGTLLGELRNGISAKPELNPPGLAILRISAVRSGSVSLKEHRFLPHGADLLAEYGLRDGDLLFTRYNGSLDLLGVCGMVRGLGNASVLYPDKLMRVRFDHDHVLPAYAERFFQSAGARDRLTAQSRSSAGQQGVSGADIKSQPFALPPFKEQRRLVEAIETALSRVDAARNHLSRIPAILKRFRQAVLAAACSGKLTEDWRSEQAKIAPWKQARLGDVADSRLGKMLDQARNVGTPTPYLRNINLRWFSFDLTDLSKMRATAQDLKEFNIKDEDLLVCEGGEPGRCAVWNLGSSGLIFQKAIHRIRLNDEVSPQWIAFNLKNDAASGALEEYFTGSGIKHLTGRSLAIYSLRLPPLEEQLEIIRRVDALFGLSDTIERRISTATTRADKLTQSILAKAFRGELVPTEAELARREGREYEPASVLLERIKKERESRPSGRTERKQTGPRATLVG